MRNILKYFTGASLLLTVLLISSCGSGSGASNTVSSNKNASNAATNNSNAANKTETVEKETRNTSPVTIPMEDLFPEIMAYDSEVDRLEKEYLKRELTVADAFLSDIKYSEITVDDSRTSNGNYIWCRGDFSDLTESSSKVKQLSDQGKPLKATVKGTVISIKKTSPEQVQFIMDPCEIVTFAKES